MSKYKVTNFGRSRHIFFFAFIWIFADTPARKYHLILSYMDNNCHQILHLSKTVVPKFKIILKTYLPKGYLFEVIPGIVSVDHVKRG